MAAMPVAAATAQVPLSRAATAASKALTVGLFMRE